MANAKNIHQRIAAVMGEITYIQKERRQGMPYSIVSHDAVTAKCRPVLLENGVIYYPVRCDTAQNGNRTECNMTVRFVNIDEPTDFIDVETCGYGIDPQDKGPGKAQSYAVKYALLKTLGLETGDDADHDDIEHSRVDPAKPTPEIKPEPKPEPKPERTDEQKRDDMKKVIASKTDADELETMWKSDRVVKGVASLPPPMQGELTKIYSDRMGELSA